MNAELLFFSTGRKATCVRPNYFERKADTMSAPLSKTIHSHISVEVVSPVIRLALGSGFQMEVKTRTDGFILSESREILPF